MTGRRGVEILVWLLMLGVAQVAYTGQATPRDLFTRSMRATLLPGSEATVVWTETRADADPRTWRMSVRTRLEPGDRAPQPVVTDPAELDHAALVPTEIQKGFTEHTLYCFSAPPDVAGTAVLIADHEFRNDELVVHSPNRRRVHAYESAGEPLLGSAVWRSELRRPGPGDMTYRGRPDQVVDGVACHVVELSPAKRFLARANGFSRQLVFIGKKDFVVRRLDNLDHFGKTIRQAFFRDIKKVDDARGFFRPMEIEIVNRLNGRRVVIRYETFALKTELPLTLFDRDALADNPCAQ